MGILANLGYGAILGPELQGKVLKPFEKAVTVMQLDEPNKAMMEAAGYKKVAQLNLQLLVVQMARLNGVKLKDGLYNDEIKNDG